jgi:hypothetical protein
MNFSRTYRLRTGLLLPLVALIGCDFSHWSESAQNAAQKAQQTVTETAEAVRTEVQEQTGQAGEAELTLGAGANVESAGSPSPAVATPSHENLTACYVIFTPQQEGRRSVLALQSYQNAARESFPSFYIHAAVEAATLAELAGKTVPAQMYLKSRESGPTLFTPDDAPLQLKIVAVEEARVTAEIVGGKLLSTSDSLTTDISGQFTAVAP